MPVGAEHRPTTSARLGLRPVFGGLGPVYEHDARERRRRCVPGPDNGCPAPLHGAGRPDVGRPPSRPRRVVRARSYCCAVREAAPLADGGTYSCQRERTGTPKHYAARAGCRESPRPRNGSTAHLALFVCDDRSGDKTPCGGQARAVGGGHGGDDAGGGTAAPRLLGIEPVARRPDDRRPAAGGHARHRRRGQSVLRGFGAYAGEVIVRQTDAEWWEADGHHWIRTAEGRLAGSPRRGPPLLRRMARPRSLPAVPRRDGGAHPNPGIGNRGKVRRERGAGDDVKGRPGVVTFL